MNIKKPLDRSWTVAAACAALVTSASLAAPHEQAAPPPAVIGANTLPGLSGGIIASIDLVRDRWTLTTVKIPTEHDGVIEVELLPESNRTPDYRVIVFAEDGVGRESPPDREYTFIGSSINRPGVEARASILPEGLVGALFMPDGTARYVQPLSDFLPGAPNHLHVIYESGQTLCEGACGTTLEKQVTERPRFVPRGGCGGALCEAEIATDADREYFASRGSNVNTTNARIAAIIHVANHQYQRDVQITHRISTQLVRTAEPDPYDQTDPNALLNQFAGTWNNNHTSIQRDIAHMFTGRDLAGSTVGIAFQSVMCSPSFGNGYALSQANYNTSFACQTDLFAHELGHNWGAQHCSPDCLGSTMNQNITCRNTFGSSVGVNSIAEIDNFADTRTCLTGVSPPANNMCTNATNLNQLLVNGCRTQGYVPDGSFRLSNINATTDGGAVNCGTISPSGGTRDVWYRFTPSVTGTVALETTAQGQGALAVYSGCPGDIANIIACSDGSSGCYSTATSCLTFFGSAGMQYLIRVAVRDGVAWPSIGLHVFSPTIINPIPNQTFACSNFYYTYSPSLLNPTCAFPAVWSLDVAPAGMTRNVNTGQIDWANPVPGVHRVVVRAEYNSGTRGQPLVTSTREYFITINSSPPAVAANPSNQSRCPGQTATFSASGSGSALTYQWQRNGVNLVNSSRISGATGPTLTITTVQAADAASYRCLISNTCGSVTTAPATLTVCTPDFNCDAAVSPQDIFDFLVAYFASDPRADFDAQGGITVQDIFDFLGAYFLGCS